jgi:hypothetical protein
MKARRAEKSTPNDGRFIPNIFRETEGSGEVSSQWTSSIRNIVCDSPLKVHINPGVSLFKIGKDEEMQRNTRVNGLKLRINDS